MTAPESQVSTISPQTYRQLNVQKQISHDTNLTTSTSLSTDPQQLTQITTYASLSSRRTSPPTDHSPPYPNSIPNTDPIRRYITLYRQGTETERKKISPQEKARQYREERKLHNPTLHRSPYSEVPMTTTRYLFHQNSMSSAEFESARSELVARGEYPSLASTSHLDASRQAQTPETLQSPEKKSEKRKNGKRIQKSRIGTSHNRNALQTPQRRKGDEKEEEESIETDGESREDGEEDGEEDNKPADFFTRLYNKQKVIDKQKKELVDHLLKDELKENRPPHFFASAVNKTLVPEDSDFFDRNQKWQHNREQKMEKLRLSESLRLKNELKEPDETIATRKRTSDPTYLHTMPSSENWQSDHFVSLHVARLERKRQEDELLQRPPPTSPSRPLDGPIAIRPFSLGTKRTPAGSPSVPSLRNPAPSVLKAHAFLSPG